jgi:UDP-N-acetyl-D-glucosamine dehydrogenase
MHLLTKQGARVTYTDPYVESISFEREELSSIDDELVRSDADCVVIVTDHSKFDYAGLVEDARLIVDTRNVLKHFSSEKIVRL